MNVAFTGKRPKDLYGYRDKASYDTMRKNLKSVLRKLISQGAERFNSGGAQGFDQVAFWVVDELKKEYPYIKNYLYIPCKEYASQWAEQGLFSKSDFEKMLQAADHVIYISETYTKSCLFMRNLAMLDDGDVLVALSNQTELTGGTGHAVTNAINRGMPVIQLLGKECEVIKEHGVQNSLLLDDLFGIKEGIICQQVNCKNAMGAGLAKAIYEKYPIVKTSYHKSFEKNLKLFGKYQVIPLTDTLSVANIYSQDGYENGIKNGIVYTDRDKLVNAIQSLISRYPERMIYVPKNIGCGLGGEKWGNIYPMLTELDCDRLRILDTMTCEIEIPEREEELEH